MKLTDQVVIITGATSGMGKTTARLFAKNGAKLVINGRDKNRGYALVEELKEFTDITFYAGDVSEPETNKQLVATAIGNYGKLNGFVTHAGILGLGNITDMDLEEWHYTLNTNFNAFFYLAKYAIPYIKENKGFIIANASIAAFKSFPNHPVYCASKAALVSLVKQLATDYSPDVRINAVCPGPVDTPLIWNSAKAFKDPEKAVENVKEATLMKRLGKPEDVSNLILFLASKEASWMTGSALTIDGGIMASH